ncbi:thiamine-phosphate kinase [Marinobacter salinexigens]|uniref:Thiamine-monophosphate kinase n=1 Tax=Marinobacter salinexigens TaxID=2919747 RepID=A0A5B0VAM1_9GAMM|nr:thiamine-phosphate kinase [Marinobacter salinexigens]KAA1171672.1 thiamine-phosphate kinase [Marinobacter salinexigens]
MGEFELIRRYFRPLSGNAGSEAIILGIGDDCAIQRIPDGHDLVFSVDTMVEGVHFPLNYNPENLAWRSLAAAVSDLAAMGASPVCFTLALTLPQSDDTWVESFARGLSQASRAFGLSLVGGDTTRGALTLSIQVHGTVPRGGALTRGGANVGDLVCVSGTLGDAGQALDYLELECPEGDVASVLARYHRPAPRLSLGMALAGCASAAIDVSDGLVADLGHILDASEVGAVVDASCLPISPALRRLAGTNAASKALYSGDDYELCVTIPREKWVDAGSRVREALTVVGHIDASRGLRILGPDGEEALARDAGFDHFRSNR